MGAQLGKARLKRQSCTGTVQLHDNRRGAANQRLIHLSSLMHHAKLLGAFNKVVQLVL